MSKEITAWVFGFFTIPVILGTVVSGVMFIRWWWGIPERTGLDIGYAIGGGAVFVAAAILFGVVFLRVAG